MTKRKNGKRALVILLAVLAALYVGHLVKVSREKTQAYETLAQQPIQAVQTISPDNLQFVMRGKLYDGKSNNQALVSPGRERRQSTDTAVQTADEQLTRALRAVAASLGIYTYDWWDEHPTAAPGAGGITLSFFDGDAATAKVQFLVVNGELRQIVAMENGWLLCRYPVDADALRELEAALRAAGS